MALLLIQPLGVAVGEGLHSLFSGGRSRDFTAGEFREDVGLGVGEGGELRALGTHPRLPELRRRTLGELLGQHPARAIRLLLGEEAVKLVLKHGP